MSTIYKIENGAVIALKGEYYADELEAYKVLVEGLRIEAKTAESKKAAETKDSGWKQPFRHACVLYFAGGSHLRFPTLRKAFEWAACSRQLAPSGEKAYRQATHSYRGGCNGAIRAQFFALRNIAEACKGLRLVKLERMGRDGNTYTAEAAK